MSPDADRLEATARALSGADPLPDGTQLASRHVAHPDHLLARAWLVSELQAIDGLTVTEAPFDALGRDDLANVVAELEGADPFLPWLVVGAHLDSTASLDAAWDPALDPAPGADDDASGCAAVLELARLLAERPLHHPVRFVLFDAEEEGLLGSHAYASEMRDDGQAVRLMLSLDPIGFDPGGAGWLWTTFDPRWSADALRLEALAAEIGSPLEVNAVDATLIGGDRRSDHAPFWDAGYPALHVASFPQPPTYHTMDDEITNVDPGFLRDTTALVEALLREVGVEATEPAPATGCAHAPSGGLVGALLAVAWARKRRSPLSRYSRAGSRKWLRGQDLNLRPSGYEPDELPGCSTPRQMHTR